MFLKYSIGIAEPKFKVLHKIPFEKKVAAKYDFSVFWAIQRPKKFFLRFFKSCGPKWMPNSERSHKIRPVRVFSKGLLFG